MSAKNRKKDKNLYEKRRVEDLKAQKKAAPDSAQSTGGMKQFNFLFSESLVTFRRMVESVKSGIFVADLNGILLYANPAFVHLLGYNTRTDTQRMNLIHEFFGDEDNFTRLVKSMEKTGSIHDYEIRFQRKDGRDFSLSINSSFVRNDSGVESGVECVVHDITEKKSFEQALRFEKEKLELILGFNERINALREFKELVDFIVTSVARILEVHRCSLMLYDEEKKELFIAGSKGIPDEVAKSVRLVVGDPIAGTVAENREPLLVKNIEYEKGLKRANRPYYKSRSFMIVPIVFEDKLLGVINVTDKDSILGHEEIFSDVDLKILTAIAREVAVTLENFKIYKDLSTLTITDPLTNIYNYRQFAKSLEQEMKRADREKGDLCIFMMDIDKFKTYNDTFGHLEGDNLLREIGGIMKSQLRATDIVCRYAGDEFCIILPGADDKGAQMSADKIVKAVRAVKTFKRPVTISIGIAAYRSGMSQKDLIACADKALYQTKQNGRNGFSIYEE